MKARISEIQFISYLRLSGTDDISDIKLSYLEINVLNCYFMLSSGYLCNYLHFVIRGNFRNRFYI